MAHGVCEGSIPPQISKLTEVRPVKLEDTPQSKVEISLSGNTLKLTLKERIEISWADIGYDNIPWMRLFVPVQPEEIGIETTGDDHENKDNRRRCDEWFYCTCETPVDPSLTEFTRSDKRKHPDDCVYHDNGYYALCIVGQKDAGNGRPDLTWLIIAWFYQVFRERRLQVEPPENFRQANFLSLSNLEFDWRSWKTTNKIFDIVKAKEARLIMPRITETDNFILWGMIRNGEEWVRSIQELLGFGRVTVIDNTDGRFPEIYKVASGVVIDRVGSLNPHGVERRLPILRMQEGDYPSSIVYINHEHALCLVHDRGITFHVFDPWQEKQAFDSDTEKISPFLDDPELNVMLEQDELVRAIQGNEGSCVIHAIFMSFVASMLRLNPKGLPYENIITDFKVAISRIGTGDFLGNIATIAACLVGVATHLGGFTTKIEISQYGGRLDPVDRMDTLIRQITERRNYYGDVPFKTPAAAYLLQPILDDWHADRRVNIMERIKHWFDQYDSDSFQNELELLVRMLEARGIEEERFDPDPRLLYALEKVESWTFDDVERALKEEYPEFIEEEIPKQFYGLKLLVDDFLKRRI